MSTPRMAPSTPLRVVAVVLNWCAEDDTAACVRSLAAQRGVGVTPLIVDNGSPDGSGERLAARFPDVAVLQTGANLGYAGGNARGIAWALEQNAEYVFVINDDAEADPTCVATLVDALDAAPDAAVAAPTIVHRDPKDLVWWAGGRFDAMRALGLHEHFGRSLGELPADARPGAAPRDVTSFSGCAVLLRTSVVRALGGFREDFFSYAEDTELGVRWRRGGYRLLHVPSALATHKITYPAPEPSAFQIRMRDRNRRRLVRLHFGARARLKAYVWFGVTRIVLGIGYALRGDRARLRAIVEGAFER